MILNVLVTILILSYKQSLNSEESLLLNFYCVELCL